MLHSFFLLLLLSERLLYKPPHLVLRFALQVVCLLLRLLLTVYSLPSRLLLDSLNSPCNATGVKTFKITHEPPLH